MSAILHCIITSIEDDRIRENLKAWKDKVNISKNENYLNELKEKIDAICPYTPYFELSISGTKEIYYSRYDDDAEEGRDALHNDVQRFLINQREKFKGATIIVKYCFWNKVWEEVKITKMRCRIK